MRCTRDEKIVPSETDKIVGEPVYCGRVEPLETTGEFWSPDNDARRIEGTLTWEPGSRARLTLRSRVIDELASPVEFTENGFSMTVSGDPARVVADGVPRVLLGDTEAGAVTCVDSYLQHLPRNLFDFETPPLQQVWDPYTLIVGAHLPAGHATKLDAVRFILDSPGWWTQLPVVGSAVGDAGEVTCERTEDGLTWLEFRPTSPTVFRSAQRVVYSMIALVQLAVDASLTPLRVQVREPGHITWLEVKTRDLDPSKTSWPDSHNLLSPSLLTLERIARWLAIEKTMDGLSSAVAEPVTGTAIQVQALTACSLIEGIHKRMVGTDCHYAVRARELQETAEGIAPGVTEPVVDWHKLVKQVRNNLAHHETGLSFEQHFLDCMIAESSAIWVMRLCLLSHAGFTDQEIADALSDHQRYEFYRENLKMHVKERNDLTVSTSGSP